MRLFPVSSLKTVISEINVRNSVGQFHCRFQWTDSVLDYEELKRNDESVDNDGAAVVVPSIGCRGRFEICSNCCCCCMRMMVPMPYCSKN